MKKEEQQKRTSGLTLGIVIHEDNRASVCFNFVDTVAGIHTIVVSPEHASVIFNSLGAVLEGLWVLEPDDGIPVTMMPKGKPTCH